MKIDNKLLFTLFIIGFSFIMCLFYLIYKKFAVYDKKFKKIESLVFYVYIRKIFKVILYILLKKYEKTNCIRIFIEDNKFKFEFIPNNQYLNQNDADVLNSFKTKYYQNYYEILNNYIHLDYEQLSEDKKKEFLKEFKMKDSSKDILTQSLYLLFDKKMINKKEKNVLFNELESENFNIFNKDIEIQKILKRMYYKI